MMLATSKFFLLLLSLLVHHELKAVTANNCPSMPPLGVQGGDTWDQEISGTGTHRFSLPDSYDGSTSMPLLLYFHGWGGGRSACGSFCDEAKRRGFFTISLEGFAGPGERNSWNGFGSTKSGQQQAEYPGNLVWPVGCEAEIDRTCNISPYGDYCYADCNGLCADDCWWTTCKDSVAQTLTVLDCFLSNFNVDMSMIWATGCSNGGMFLFELADDPRIAPYLAGIAPQVGLPHFGFNQGPSYNMSFFGSWGLRDTTVPPIEGPSSLNCQVSCRTSESDGWFYTSSDCTTSKWADDLNLITYTEDIGKNLGYRKIDKCWFYTSATNPNVEVVGCHFNGNHMLGCNQDHQIQPMLDFMESHPKGSVCGDSICDGAEDCNTCPNDCGGCVCGDNICNGDEDCITCPNDCGICPFCGDDICNNNEDCSTCPTDCGACPVCGDNNCDDDEDCNSCSNDCGTCPPTCNCGTINDQNTCVSCSNCSWKIGNGPKSGCS